MDIIKGGIDKVPWRDLRELVHRRRDPNRKSFRNHMSQYQHIARWLKTNHPTPPAEWTRACRWNTLWPSVAGRVRRWPSATRE